MRYLATIYGQFPNVVFAKASSGITTAADLEGRKIGTPGRYGSGWIMLQALLGSAGLTPEDVEIVEYPDFTQRAAVEQGAVDAATGFANNEPVQLELAGEPVVLLRIDDITPLPGPGLIAGASTLEAKRAAIEAFVATTLRAMDAITADPSVGLDAAIVAVPELATARDAQLAILEATIESWSGPAQVSGGLGAIDRGRLDGLDRVPDDARARSQPGHRRRPRRRPGCRAATTERAWRCPTERHPPIVVAATGPGRRAGGPGRRPARRSAGASPPTSSILGGGYTGLWTAWRLTELAPDARGSSSSRRTSAAAARPGGTAGSRPAGGTSCRR